MTAATWVWARTKKGNWPLKSFEPPRRRPWHVLKSHRLTARAVCGAAVMQQPLLHADGSVRVPAPIKTTKARELLVGDVCANCRRVVEART